jgi:hypothetical protein
VSVLTLTVSDHTAKGQKHKELFVRKNINQRKASGSLIFFNCVIIICFEFFVVGVGLLCFMFRLSCFVTICGFLETVRFLFSHLKSEHFYISF